MDDQALVPGQGDRDEFGNLSALTLRLLRRPRKWERAWEEERILMGQLPPNLHGVLPFPSDLRLLGSLARRQSFIKLSNAWSAHNVLIAYDSPTPATELATLYNESMLEHGWQRRPVHSGPLVALNPVEPARWLAYYGLYYERLEAANQGFGGIFISLHTTEEGITSVFIDLFRSIPDATAAGLDAAQSALPTVTEDIPGGPAGQPTAHSESVDGERFMRRFLWDGDFNVLTLPKLQPPSGARQEGGGGSSTAGHYTATTYTVEIMEGPLELASLAEHYAKQLAQAGWRRQEQHLEGPLAESTWLAPQGERGTWRATMRMVALPGSHPRCHMTLRAHIYSNVRKN